MNEEEAAKEDRRECDELPGTSRTFKIAEQKAFQIRMESFNLPNHPNFNLPENRVDVISGGTITRAKNNRNLQLGARLEF